MNIVIYKILSAAIEILRLLILAYLILSWVRTLNETLWQIHEALAQIVEPLFKPFRQIVPTIDLGGMALDLTPIVVYILLGIIRAWVLPVFLAIPF